MNRKPTQRLLRGLVHTACLISLLGLFACQGGGGSGGPTTGSNTPLPDDGGTTPPAPLPDDGGTTPPAPLPGPTLSTYKLTVTASVPDQAADGGLAYNRLVAAAAPEATDGFDNAYDIRALLAGPVEAYFSHTAESGYDPTSTQLWQDVRAGGLPQEWIVEVRADSGRTVTLFWAAPTGETGCGTYQFSLRDADGQLGQADLCTAGSRTYDGDGQPRHFVLRVS